MQISKLHLFAKKTDATSALRGYVYQVLKTVETWVNNYQAGVDEEIYCDFEEDIFQKDRFSKTAKFRQIKLYARNFSFSSEEINKAISHFFMIHVQTDYSTFEKEFVFEANSGVAQQRLENDAILLKNWDLNQDGLNGDLLIQCTTKVKEIVGNFIRDQAAALQGKKDAILINEALLVYESITEENWIGFTKSIKWKFDSTTPDVAFSLLKTNIENAIIKLPFLIDSSDIATIFGLLHTTVWEKASMQNSEDRKLTISNLQQVILQSTNSQDKWYWQVYERWKGIKVISQFFVGEFYEVIDATRHCRQNYHLVKHDDQWLNILKIYIDKLEIGNDIRRTAIYEYLWLRFRPNKNFTKPYGNLIGEKEYFDFYFSDFTDFRNAAEIENAQSLMTIALTSCFYDITDLNIDHVKEWFQKIETLLNTRLKNEKNANELCHLFENLGTHYLFLNSRRKEGKSTKEFMTPLNKILPLLKKADFYDVTALSERLNKYINLLIKVDPTGNSELIEAIELFTEKLNPIVVSRHGLLKAGKVEIEKGIQYLNSDDPQLLLNALNCFHKAKNLYFQQEHIEGYVLSLINIAQLYSAIDMNLAAKYYAVSAAWVSIQHGDRYLLKRIADSYSLVFYSEFRQGSWMNAIISFADYFNARDFFNSTPLDIDVDEIPFKIMAELSIILHATPKLSSQLTSIVNDHIGHLGHLGEDFINPLFPGLEKDYPDIKALKPLLEGKLSDHPLNDVGMKRYIRFHALGSIWEVSFENNYETTSIAEEFCGIMQIMLTEIAFTKMDMHLLNCSIKIELEVNSNFNPPEQKPSHTQFSFTVSIENCDSKDAQEVNLHTAKISTSILSILNDLSLLPRDKFMKIFNDLFLKNDLARKTLVHGPYQRIYRNIFLKQRYDNLKRQDFETVEKTFLNLPVPNKVLEGATGISKLYNHQKASQNIINRYKNCYSQVYLTLNKLKADGQFPALINSFRREGWLDWHIIITMRNFILNYKTNLIFKPNPNETEELNKDRFAKIFNNILDKHEHDCYVEFPLFAFQTNEFKWMFNDTLIRILESFGLENRAMYPQFSAIKELLENRFNMRIDNPSQQNPLITVL
jgi:hypothetical protein